MLSFKRVLIPTDFSRHAEAAVHAGVDLARRFEAEVHLLHVVEGPADDRLPGFPDLSEVYDRLEAAASTTLVALLAEARAKGLETRPVVTRGRPAAAVVDYVARHHVDLVVMATHGRQGAARDLVGSTAERVVRHASATVVTLPVADDGPPAPFRVKTILVPVDFSRQARRALVVARAMAVRNAARVLLLHVVAEAPPLLGDDPPAVLQHHICHLDREGCRLLERFAGETAGPSVPEAYHVARGRPATAVATFARQAAVDLVVQSALGSSEEECSQLGSVAEEVVRRAPCPVMTVKGRVAGVTVQLTSEEGTTATWPSRSEGRFDSAGAARDGQAHTGLRIDKIVHPTDFSLCSLAAFPFALDVARRADAALHLLHVTPALGEDAIRGAFALALDDQAFQQRMHHEVEAQLDALIEGFDAGGVNPQRVHVASPSPAEAILAYGRSQDVDLVVMGTHGGRGWRRLLMGSVAREVILRSRCPVLAVPHGNTQRAGECTVRRILVPVDFSVHSINALSYAKELAALVGASLDVLHVVTPLPGLMHRSWVPDEEDAAARLEWLFDEVQGAPFARADFYVERGHPAGCIARHVAQRSSDLIVMATHGLTALKRFPMGSVTEKVLDSAACPVFVTKPFGKSLFASRKVALARAR